VLLYLDRTSSCILGRTCSMQYDDFDAYPPIECDDEFWEHPTHPFQQPAGVPSRVTFFNTLMRLNHILSFTLRLLYSIVKVPALCPFTEGWTEEVIAEMDSALNRWRGQIPDHLRWDPMRKDPVFFDQSVALLCAYHQLQILIHRPFIPMVHKSAPTALPSLAVCTSAARACANLVDIQRRRTGNVTASLNLNAVFTSGLVLLLNVLSGKRAGLLPATGPCRDMVHVHKCMEIVRMYEDRWQTAGMLWDTLAELACVGQLPLPDLHTPFETNSQQEVNRNGDPLWHHPPSADQISGILFGSQSLGQTFDPAQFHAPYAPNSFADGAGADPGMLGPVSVGPSSITQTPVPFQPEMFQPEDMLYPDPAQASRELESMMNLIDSDTMALWTNAPMGLGADDWEAYFSNFDDMTQGQAGQGADWSPNRTM